MAPPRRPWFRFYVEAIHDRKLRRRPPGDRWLWVVLLAVAREADEPGALIIGNGPASIEDLADLAALKPKDVEKALAYFTLEGMLTDDGSRLVVTKFRDRQFESDTSADRMAKLRGSDDDVTGHRRHCDVDRPSHRRRSDDDGPPDVTAMKGRSSRARVTDTEVTETETELKATPPLPSVEAPPTKRRRQRLPEDWQPSETLLTFAAQKCPTVDVAAQTDLFRDHWRGKGEVRDDWDATFRNWLRRAPGFAPHSAGLAMTNGNGHHPGRSQNQINADAVARRMGYNPADTDPFGTAPDEPWRTL